MKTGIMLAVLVVGLGFNVLGQTEVLTNGGFETGTAGWQLDGGAAVSTSGPAHSGSARLTLGGAGTLDQSSYQIVTLPTNTALAALSYFYRIETFDGQGVERANFLAAIGNAAGNVVLTNLHYESNIDQPIQGTYQQKIFDLTRYAGQTIQIQFWARTVNSIGTYFNIDDVSVLALGTSDLPPNDYFTNRVELVGTNVSVVATNLYAGNETGEPNHVGKLGGRSLWWSWTASEAGTVSVTTDGSTFDTLLAAYTGGAVNHLTRVAANDDEVGTRNLTSKVSFNVSAGTQYQIAVDGVEGDAGTIVLGLRFQSNPFVALKGAYAGLFSGTNGVSHTNAGFFTATLTDKGSLSSKLQLAGRSYSLSGKFPASGFLSNSIIRNGQSPLSVQLQVDLFGGDLMTGVVSDGTWTADLTANRAVYSKKTNPAPLSGGKYTLVVAGSEDASTQPGGCGFGTVKVDAAGTISFSGSLGDGTKVSQKAFLSKQNQWPLYLKLYSGKGAMQGWLTFTNETDTNPSGFVSWSKPADPKAKLYRAGFETNGLPLVGSIYSFTSGVPVLSLTNGGVVLLEKGNLSQSITNPFSLGANNKVLGTNKLSLSISTSSGLFKGKVLNPATGKAIAVSGALLQSQNAGFGCFLGTNQSGRVYLGP